MRVMAVNVFNTADRNFFSLIKLYVNIYLCIYMCTYVYVLYRINYIVYYCKKNIIKIHIVIICMTFFIKWR